MNDAASITPRGASPTDLRAQLEGLRREGADQIDPVRFCYIEALARRSLAYHGAVRQLLDARLAQALAAYRKKVVAPLRPASADPASQISPLVELVGYIEQQCGDGLDQMVDGRTELKTMRRDRATWAKLSAERQMTKAFAQRPHNAGPLNSHLLVLRAIEAMRELSPDYLNRFVSYADTLLWLDQADTRTSRSTRKPAARKTKR